MKIDAKVDVRETIKQLVFIKDRQLPFATSLAINRTAQRVKEREEHEIRDVFDRPTPYIQKSVFIRPSNKTNLTAIVNIKDQAIKGTPATKVLQAEIAGGMRRLKKYEVALRSAGVLPSGYFTVPGQAAKIDQYGNISQGQIKQILSYFRANPDAGYTSNSTDKTRARLKRSTKSRRGIEYVVMKPEGAPLGIWMRVFSNFGTAIRPILMFVTRNNYEAIFDFEFVARKTVEKEFGAEFIKAWEFAKSTSR